MIHTFSQLCKMKKAVNKVLPLHHFKRDYLKHNLMTEWMFWNLNATVIITHLFISHTCVARIKHQISDTCQSLFQQNALHLVKMKETGHLEANTANGRKQTNEIWVPRCKHNFVYTGKTYVTWLISCTRLASTANILKGLQMSAAAAFYFIC